VKAADLLNVNPVLVDRVRLSIMANLSLVDGPVDFNTLLEELELTKGNLSTHLRKLEDVEFILVEKTFVDRKPRTTYQCTRKGKEEMRRYLAAMESLLKNVKKLK